MIVSQPLPEATAPSAALREATRTYEAVEYIQQRFKVDNALLMSLQDELGE